MTVSLAFCLRVVLAAVFGFAGLAKALDLSGSRKATADFGVPPWLAPPIGNLLPVAELALAALLILGSTARAAAVAALALLVAFLFAITLNLLRGKRPDCHCFGQARSRPIGWHAVLRNAVLALGAGWLVASAPQESYGDNAITGLARSLDVSDTMLLIAALAVAVLSLAIFVWQLFRQQGRLLLRIDDLDRRLSGSDAAQGLPVDAPAPRFELLASLLDRGVASLMLFTDPKCGPCTGLLPTIAQWQQEGMSRLAVVVVSCGDADANRALVDRYGLKNVVVQRDHEIAQAFRIAGTPAAVLVRADGRIGSSTALGPDAIADLRTSVLALTSAARIVMPGDFETAEDAEVTRYGTAVR